MVLIIVASIAALSLQNGFSGDQALFLIYAKAINNGAILYRDVWDIKQPGIFIFYLIAGKSFGFTETGIHLFEIIYWLIFSVLLIFGLRKYFTNPLFALLTPIFTAGLFYTVSGSLHLTQVEELAGFPLFLSLWFCQNFLENLDKKLYLFLTGIFGGIVLIFKLLFLPMLFAFWFWLFVFCFFLYGKQAKRFFISGGLIFCGLIIPVALTIIYFAANGALGDLAYTTFIYPFDAVREIDKMEDRTGVLFDGLIWFLKSYFPVIVLTLLLPVINIKFFFTNRKNKKDFFIHDENFLFSCLFLWILSGLFVIFIQKLSWWEYHYSLLIIPLGILATKCLENFVEAIRNDTKIRRKFLAQTLLFLMAALAFIPAARRFANKIRQFGDVETIEIGERKFGVTGDAAADYKSISADVAFLKTENPRASIFVVSNPLYYYLSDSPPVFSANGAMSDMFTDFEWRRLNREMREKQPEYIFIETKLIKPIKEENTFFINIVEKNYSIYTTGERGSFYKFNELK